jgi:hypothetical protein
MVLIVGFHMHLGSLVVIFGREFLVALGNLLAGQAVNPVLTVIGSRPTE